MQRTDTRLVSSLLKTHGQHAFTEMTLRFGKSFRHRGVVFTCEPSVVEALLMDRPNTEMRPPVHRAMAKLPGADGILFMDGEPWLKRARALAPVFHRNHVTGSAATMYATARAHVARWEDEGSGADLYDAVQQLGAATVLAVGYGLDPADPHAVRLVRSLVHYKQFTMSADRKRRLDRFDAGLEQLLTLPWILTGIVRMGSHVKKIGTALSAVLANASANPPAAGWLKQLLEADLPTSELVDEVSHLYTAFNAIDFVACAALVELARDPVMAGRVRAELAPLSETGLPPTREDLAKLPFTGAFILEVLRRYPVSMGIARRTGVETEIEGEKVPSGSEVIVLLHALHHHPDFWGGDARETKPERWLDSPEPAVPFSYVPFLQGPRKCIGRDLAELHLLNVLTAVVPRLDIRLRAEPVIPPFMIPRFAGPIPFEARRAGTGSRGAGAE